MKVRLEFVDRSGSDPIGPNHLHGDQWNNYGGHLPNIGDVLNVDFGERYKVVGRTFYFMQIDIPHVALHCERMPAKD